MIDTVQTMLAAAYAIRWVLVFLLVVCLIVWVGVVVGQRNEAEKRERRARHDLTRLKKDLADERAWVAHLEGEAAADRARIVALPARQSVTR